MLVVVTGVSFLVHLYSVGYMHGDGGYHRFFAYLSLFTFSMLMLVLSGNFLLLYVFWEAVGLCSYLLIGFWFHKKSAADAGKKAFLVNRVGDFGFALGILLLIANTGRRWTTSSVFALAPQLPAGDRDLDLPAALRRRLRQVRAAAAARLAAGRDGGPDAGLGADPRRDDGHGRRLHGRPLQRALHALADRDAGRRGRRHADRRHGRRDRADPDRPQADHGLQHGEPARLHVPRPRRRRLGRRDLPPLHARLLQGAALPRLRQRHARDRRGLRRHPPGAALPAHPLDGDAPSSSARSRWPASPRSPASLARR